MESMKSMSPILPPDLMQGWRSFGEERLEGKTSTESLSSFPLLSPKY
jgi:hypothetical protein